MLFPENFDYIFIEKFEEDIYKQALQWVFGNKKVFILSEIDFKSDHPNVVIYHLESPLLFEVYIKEVAWYTVLKQVQVIGSEYFLELFQKFHRATNLILSEMADWHVPILKNARENNSPHKDGLLLKGAFQNLPALIVGGGPSLKKNGHLIKKFQDKALIFAGGSALDQIDVDPHFACMIDPSAPKKKVSSPLCYQARMNGENFREIVGEKILFPDSSSEAINWLYDQTFLDMGWTVGNFMVKIAALFGCSPIILVGMDYAYVNGVKYASIEGEMGNNLIEKKGLMTQSDWLMAIEWMERFSEKYPLINASEGGLLDITSKNLQTVLESLTQSIDIKTQVMDVLKKIPTKEKSLRFKEWDESVKRLKLKNDESEIFYEKLFSPLWKVWEPVFKREGDLEIHKELFFESVLNAHG